MSQTNTNASQTPPDSGQNRTAIIVAVIGLVGTIVAALIGVGALSSSSRPSGVGNYQVRVVDDGTSTPIANAQVRLESGDLLPIDAVTDSAGLAVLSLDAFPAGSPGRLVIEADGYTIYAQNIALVGGQPPRTVRLSTGTAVSAAPSTSPAPAADPTSSAPTTAPQASPNTAPATATAVPPTAIPTVAATAVPPTAIPTVAATTVAAPPPPLPLPEEAKVLGESFAVEGLRIALTGYDIVGTSAQSIQLSFSIGNQGDQPQVVQYYNTAINVTDDLGTSFENGGSSWSELKEDTLNPGQSVELGAGAEHEFPYIGSFSGDIPEEARYLIVTFSPFMGATNLQWVIDLNASTGQQQIPAPGTPVALKQAYQGDGLKVTLDAVAIESERVGLTLFVQNTSTHHIALRYRNTAISVSDDTGAIFNNSGADQFSTYVKKTLLAPGETIKLYSYFRTHELDTLGFYEGKASPGATYISVRLSRLLGLSEMEWRVPLS